MSPDLQFHRQNNNFIQYVVHILSFKAILHLGLLLSVSDIL